MKKMDIHSRRTKVFILTFLFSLSVVNMVSVLHLRTTMPQSFVPPRRVFDGYAGSMDFLCANVWFLAYVSDGSIHVLTSPDGEDWSEIEPPEAGRHQISLLRDVCLVKNRNQVGIIWVDSTADETWGSTFSVSMADTTWSEPVTLFQRKEASLLNDALLLDDGTLLLMWEEPITEYLRNGERIIEGTSSVMGYKAILYDKEVVTEELIDPGMSSFHIVHGFSFVQDERGHMQCIFHYRNGMDSFFKSESLDGRTWGPPEQVPFKGIFSEEFIYLEDGEIGALRHGKREVALARSKDWEKWEEDLLIRIDEYYDVPPDNSSEGVRITRASIAKDSHGVLWVAFQTEYGIYVSHYSEDLGKKQQETKETIGIRSLLWNINFIIAGLIFLWMWKDSKGAVTSYIVYFIAYVFLLEILYAISALYI